jgi:hypothetical protein
MSKTGGIEIENPPLTLVERGIFLGVEVRQEDDQARKLEPGLLKKSDQLGLGLFYLR